MWQINVQHFSTKTVEFLTYMDLNLKLTNHIQNYYRSLFLENELRVEMLNIL